MYTIINDDCLSSLKTIPENSIDSLITDPPAGISFMGKEWDSGNNFIPAMTEVFKETLRVLKPGAHGLVWALPRTSHWTATALEQAGFEIRDVVTHVFGSGFPKSLDISKAIDKAAGVERELGPTVGELNGRNIENHKKEHDILSQVNGWDKRISEPSTDEAKQWQGWGTALKPASEHWILIRKPLSEKTVAQNVLKHGTGGINVDECRIEGQPRTTHSDGNYTGPRATVYSGAWGEGYQNQAPSGRFPSNFVLSHNEDCELVGIKEIKNKGGVPNKHSQKSSVPAFTSSTETSTVHHFDPDTGKESVGSWNCTEGCAVKMLDEQSGGASRFFKCFDAATRFRYQAKASKKDRNEGLEELPIRPTHRYGAGLGEGLDPNAPAMDKNHHPTVKSTKLMEYLITLITPPNGVVLDPFMGSGSTGKAALKLGFRFYGVEKDASYFEIARKRLSCVQGLADND